MRSLVPSHHCIAAFSKAAKAPADQAGDKCHLQPGGGLGVGAMQKRVVVIDDAIAIRPMVYLSFVFDHRLLDGASADRFLMKVKETLENWS